MFSFFSRLFHPKKATEETSAIFEAGKIRVSTRLIQVQGSLSQQEALDSLKAALPSLHRLVKDAPAQNAPISGKFIVGFRTEPNGMIRMAFENESSLTGETGKDLVSRFIGTAMSKQWQFIQSAEISLVKAEFEIDT